MRFAYIRTSTKEQDGQGQRNSILEYSSSNGLKIDKWVYEQVSSRIHRQDRDISRIINDLNPGDEVITSELSRLGRSSITEIYAIIEEIRDKKGTLKIISEDLLISSGELDIKTQAVLGALSIASKVERDLISERTKHALQARKNAGVKLGRPSGKSKLDSRADEIKEYQNLGLNITAISKLMHCSRATLYSFLNKSI
jgi:DNA invertase Pin-like site-specific DNA recombinase